MNKNKPVTTYSPRILTSSISIMMKFGFCADKQHFVAASRRHSLKAAAIFKSCDFEWRDLVAPGPALARNNMADTGEIELLFFDTFHHESSGVCMRYFANIIAGSDSF